MKMMFSIHIQRKTKTFYCFYNIMLERLHVQYSVFQNAVQGPSASESSAVLNYKCRSLGPAPDLLKRRTSRSGDWSLPFPSALQVSLYIHKISELLTQNLKPVACLRHANTLLFPTKQLHELQRNFTITIMVNYQNYSKISTSDLKKKSK